MIELLPTTDKKLLSVCVCVGTGKSLTCQEVSSQAGLVYVDVGVFARENGLLSGWDEQLQCHVLDDDMVQNCADYVLGLCSRPHEYSFITFNKYKM